MPSVKGHSSEKTKGLIILTTPFPCIILFIIHSSYKDSGFSQYNEQCLWVKLRNKNPTVFLYTIDSYNYESHLYIHLHYLLKPTISEITMK